LADRGIYFGTSSWKYDGWLGSIYSEDRYLTRGKFSNAKFEQDCLTEYAEVFPTVCGDLTFYQFPSEEYWAKLFSATPESFIFGFKVPEEITVSTWPKHARYGRRAGLANERASARRLVRGLGRRDGRRNCKRDRSWGECRCENNPFDSSDIAPSSSPMARGGSSCLRHAEYRPAGNGVPP
jgi:hypothetical protein